MIKKLGLVIILTFGLLEEFGQRPWRNVTTLSEYALGMVFGGSSSSGEVSGVMAIAGTPREISLKEVRSNVRVYPRKDTQGGNQMASNKRKGETSKRTIASGDGRKILSTHPSP